MNHVPGRARPTAGLVLAALVLVGTCLRLYGLSAESLWVDEGYTAFLAKLTPAEYVQNVLHTVRNILPPLYFTVLHYWTGAAGFSETALRLPSAIIGVAAILLLYRFVDGMFGRRAALLSAAALTVSVFHLRYSQEARMYELLAFLSLLSLHLLVRLLAQRRARDAVALAVVGTLIVYTHHYGLLIIGAEWLYVALLWLTRSLEPGAARRWLLSSALFAVLITPWAVIFVNQLHKVGDHPWLRRPTWRSAHDVLVAFAGTPWTLAAFAVLLLLGTPIGRRVPQRLVSRQPLTDDEQHYLLLWLAFAVPLLLAYGYSVAVTPVFGQKYVIASSVPLLVLVALGAQRLPGRATGSAVFALALATSAPALYGHYHDVTKEQWREATRYVESRAASGDVLLFNAGYGLQNGFDAYARRDDLVKLAFPLGSDEFALVPTASQLADLPRLTAGHPHAWIIYGQSRDFSGSIARALGNLSTDGTCQNFVGNLIACSYTLRPVAG